MDDFDDVYTEDENVNLIDILRKAPDGIEKSLSRELVIKILNENINHWKNEPKNDESLIVHLSKQFGDCKDGKLLLDKYEDKTVTSQDLYWVYHREMLKRIRLETLLRQKHLMETAGDPSTNVDDIVGTEFAIKIGELQECIHRAYQCLLSDLEMRKVYDKSVDRGCPPLVDPFGYIPFQISKLTNYERLIVYLLRKLNSYGYRRYQGMIYEQIISLPDAEGRRYPTKAWKYKSEIKSFIEDECRKEDHFNHWQSIMTANNLSNAEKYLVSCLDHEFSELKPNRLWHSFQNGIYSIEHANFYHFNDVPSYIVTCKYHDQKFDTSIINLPWHKVPTPHIDSIIQYQFHIDQEVIKSQNELQQVLHWFYGLIGRLLFPLNTKDNWQVMPFLIGKGKTGKSSLLKIIGKFFNEEDVAVLSNNSQKGFGLETIYNKYMWQCFEVKNDFTLDQGQLQSMISGENVSIQRKFKEALNVVWNTPGIIAGNEAPSWTDNSGSISRRFVLIYFDKTVKTETVDPALEMKAKAQIGNTIHKMAKAYHELYERYGNKDIWAKDVLPYYYHHSKQRLKMLTHSLYYFLGTESSLLHGDKKYFMTFARLMFLFKTFCNEHGLKTFNWKEGSYETVFEDYNIIKRKLDARSIELENLSYKNERAKPGDIYLYGITESSEKFMFENKNVDSSMQIENVVTATEIIQELEAAPSENIIVNVNSSSSQKKNQLKRQRRKDAE